LFVEVGCECGNERDVLAIKIKNGERNACSRNCKMWLSDITNQKFGFLTVIKEIERKENGNRQYLCKCDCGKEVKKDHKKLLKGSTRYCWFDCDLKKRRRFGNVESKSYRRRTSRKS